MRTSLFASFILISILAISQKRTSDTLLIKKVDSLVKYTKTIWYSDLEEANKIADYVMEISLQNSYRVGEARAYNLLGVIHSNRGEKAEAMYNYERSSDMFRELGNDLWFADAQYNMGVLLQDDKQFAEALKSVNQAYQYYLDTGIRSKIAMSSMTLGNLYLTNDRGLEAALGKMEESASISREDNDVLMLAYALALKGDAHIEHNGDVSKAIENFDESIKLMTSKQPDNHWSLGFSHVGLAKSYLKQGDLSIALSKSDRAIKEYNYINQKLGLRNAYQNRVDILEQTGDYKETVNTYKMLMAYSDSIYSEESSRQINRLQTQFDTKEKETEIASLSQQASIQALEIKQKNQAIIVGVVIILFVLVALYFFYKQRETKKQQSQTELEQRFLRSQLNPHFISNALVAVQSFMLKNDTESAALYLTKFSKLMREILENSRKEFIPVEEEVGMLKNFLDIHKLRLNSFDYSIEIDENINPEADTIPPMFVQPFVENAVEHGIMSQENGKINLKFTKEGDYISIDVNDNGVGLSSSKSSNHNSLSTTIIQERMDLFNRSLKKKIELVVGNLKNENGEVNGTKVELKVPFSYI